MAHLRRSLVVLIPALLSLSLPAQAQTVNLSALQTNLQAAVCQNDWNQALRAIAPLIGSPGISTEYRQELLQFRAQLEDLRAAQAELTNFPNCEGVIRVTQPLQSTAPSQPLDWYRAVQNLQESRGNFGF
ncbi:hypothetical protein H6G89_02130 [Oscillatoria sp. FACHB-1407]|uniref:hypothetical protein n=1 Tax=Oscillatoria sp. FACHB-1407 TaxID=2692847 RepID=UPI0016827BBD|nr:hypothetical protein [Oscillatoria sp. FACHB-1407]MBD2459831.1 hypothetical protein [Oscillatoria sp. FACHB-1407]